MKKDDLKDIADADRIEAFVWTYIIEPDALKVAHKLKLRLRKKEPAEGYYVYLLIDSRDKKIFYVGKGKGKRMHAHVVETTHGRIANSVKSDKINEILAAGAEVLERVIFTTKRESVAFTVERFLIDRLKEHGLTNIVRGVVTNNQARVRELEHRLKHMKSRDEWIYGRHPAYVVDFAITSFGSLENLYDWMVTQHMELLEAYRNES
jgi:hypothetical protein|uniref:GIY-YIG nuclease superfamily protein n=1 Tax=Podoviridae sp. ctiwu7 TaxID=2825269 RepID=A0A8S5QDE3_9CAUD|nr:MAG TPA: GIY-YIG nuclease superfamily protein [Podoviridae sp. ctiwu7]DAW04571.1 MAG TPA: GIY-YIG nuclease superfamily protein [Bacteriophage sp.]